MGKTLTLPVVSEPLYDLWNDDFRKPWTAYPDGNRFWYEVGQAPRGLYYVGKGLLQFVFGLFVTPSALQGVMNVIRGFVLLLTSIPAFFFMVLPRSLVTGVSDLFGASKEEKKEKKNQEKKGKIEEKEKQVKKEKGEVKENKDQQEEEKKGEAKEEKVYELSIDGILKMSYDKCDLEKIKAHIDKWLVVSKDINITDDNGMTLLELACEDKNDIHLALVTHLLTREEVNINHSGPYGSALSLACKHGSFEIAKLLLSQEGINPNARANERKQTAMQALCTSQLDEPKLARALIEKGADVTLTDRPGGDNALNLACYFGTTEIVKVILELTLAQTLEAMINPPAGEITPLHLACQGQCIEEVRLLLDAGADYNRKYKGKTPAEMLPSKRDIHPEKNGPLQQFNRKSDAIRTLIRQYKKYETQFSRYVDQLDLGELKDLVKELEEAQIPLTRFLKFKYNDGNTLLTCVLRVVLPLVTEVERRAAVLKCMGDIIKYLAELGIDLNELEQLPEYFQRKPMAALHIAASRGYAELVRILINLKADPDLLTPDGISSLEWATTKPDIVEILLDAGANPDPERDKGKSTPLSRYVRDGKTDLVELVFSKYKGEIDLERSRNNGNQTLLHIACAKGYKRIVGILLEHDADPNAQDEDEYRPLDFTNKSTIVAALLAKGADPHAREQEYKVTPFERFIDSGKPKCVKAVLANSPKAFDIDGVVEASTKRTWLHVVSQSKFLARLAPIFIQYSADPSVKDIHGKTPFMLAIETGQGDEAYSGLLVKDEQTKVRDTFKQFKQKDVDQLATLEDAKKSLSDIFKKHGVGIHNICYCDGRTFLHRARTVKVAEQLLNAGADINAKNDWKETPLFRLCKRFDPKGENADAQLELFDFLLANGARVDIANEDEKTPKRYIDKKPALKERYEKFLEAQKQAFKAKGSQGAGEEEEKNSDEADVQKGNSNLLELE